MARPKGSKNKQGNAQEPVYASPQEKTIDNLIPANERAEIDLKVFGYDTCIYHENFPPCILKAGEPMPEGWQQERVTSWKHDENGKWSKVNE